MAKLISGRLPSLNVGLSTADSYLNVVGGVNITGITTLASVSAGNTTGLNGQYLQSTGVGVTWASGTVLRNTSSTVAIAGTNTFTLNYTVGFLDVYVNGVKLAPSDFTATNGTSVIFNESTYGGEVVDFHAFNTPSTGVSPNVLHNPPTTSSSTGLPGQMSYDASYLYVCIAPDSWKRASLSSF